MNIFVLDEDLDKCAQYHCDKHVVKMILETAQILCSALHMNGVSEKEIPYKLTHKHHPCVKWAAEARQNFNWVCNLGLALCKEYTYRYNKIHKCENIIKYLMLMDGCMLGEGSPTKQPLAMPDKYKTDDVIQSYRNYYNGDKQHIFSWKNRDKPYWIEA